jgi:hypothetical protein
MANSQNDPLCCAAHVSINTAVIVGVIALITNSTIIYSMAFTSIIVGFVVGTIYLVNKK